VVADFERDGLLEEPERSARVNLLRQLTDAGVNVAELRQPVAEERLGWRTRRRTERTR
jgi:hypothetical protein